MSQGYKTSLHVGLLLLLCGVLYFPFLKSIPFFDKGEPREAMAVQDIVRRGEWLVPLKRATDVPSKPPLFHWTAAAVYHLTGELDEATVRLPSAIYGTFGVLLVYFFSRRLFGAETGFLSAAILATIMVYQDQAMDARVDMTLCFFVTLSLVLFYALCRGFLAHPGWFYLFFAVTGIGTTAKGPLGVLLPALVAASFLAVERRWDLIRRFVFHPGVLLTVLFGAGWYVIAVLRGGEGFFDRQILEENLSRFAGGSGHSHPVYYYVSYLFSQGLPWALLFPVVIYDAFARRGDSDLLFLKVWCAAMFLFFSISIGKRPVYLLPIYPALAVLTAVWLMRAGPAAPFAALYFRAVALFGVSVAVILALVAAGGFWSHDPAFMFGFIADLLKPRDRANFELVRNRLADFGLIFDGLTAVSAVLWLLLSSSLWRARWRAAAVYLVMVAAILSVVARGLIVPKLAEARSYRPFMMQVNERIGADDKVYLYGRTFNSDPLVFYHGEPIETLNVAPEELSPGNSGALYLIMAEDAWGDFLKRREDGVVLFRSRGTGPEGDSPLVFVKLPAQGAHRPGDGV